jgi:anti-sigma factor RsiW
MNEEQQLKLQAFLDGELPEDEARATAAWVARDAEATALLGELRNTRKALTDFEPAARLPESREFYWSKIEREIQRLEPVPRPVQTVSLASLLRRLLVPAGAVAALLIAGIVAIHPSGANASADAALADAGAFTYRDQAEGMTVVWLSYPAEK